MRLKRKAGGTKKEENRVKDDVKKGRGVYSKGVGIDGLGMDGKGA